MKIFDGSTGWNVYVRSSVGIKQLEVFDAYIIYMDVFLRIAFAFAKQNLFLLKFKIHNYTQRKSI